MAEERKPRPRKKRRRVCLFCIQRRVPDYKDIDTLRKFITDRGKIKPRRSSACCAKHQRWVAMAVKRARQAGLLPYAVD